jgi:hypothetical protein
MNLEIDLSPFDNTYKEKTEKFDVDLLEAACVIKEMTPNFGSLGGADVAAKITPEIKVKAEAIRKYYTRKWFWSNLSGDKPLSQFRQRANYLLESRTQEVMEKDQGIYIKLPWFYEEDIVYEEFKKEYITTDLPRIAYSRGSAPIKLTFLKTSKSWQGKRKLVRYWFTNDSKFLYAIDLEMQNPLLSFFEEAIFANPTCLFECVLSENRIDKLYYYRVQSFKLLKENNA